MPFEGNYSSWLQQKSERLRMIEKKETQRQKTLQRELDWIRNSHEGRRQKNQARIKSYEQLAGEQTLDNKSEVFIQIAPGNRAGRTSSRGQEPQQELPDRRPEADAPGGLLLQRPPRRDRRRDRPQRHRQDDALPHDRRARKSPTPAPSNSAPPSSSPTSTSTATPSTTARPIFEEITDGKDTIELGKISINSRVYVGRFNFRGSQQQKKVGECSGGERNRIHLAKLLRRGGNLLLLDEPTNDLDVNTMRVLEQGLIDFPGCAMVISHDRFFLDRICTHLLVMEGDGKTHLVRRQFCRLRRDGPRPRPQPRRPPPQQVQTLDAAVTPGIRFHRVGCRSLSP